ncbi:maltose permease [Calocera viscosa TUFC12733]|uniref:Maltose permease n=1 Tax=Calocera viscosa (strain TUFC12733) TaxID=1330018 RepID=A0A167PF05_CALVF|nr:maltose permease [Calocera viscosa TUFC12733]
MLTDKANAIDPRTVPTVANNEDVPIGDVKTAEHTSSGLQAARMHWRTFLWCMFMSIGVIIGGYDASTNGVLAVPAFRRNFGALNDDQYVLSAAWQNGFYSATQITRMIGSISVGYMSDRYGNKISFAVCSCISVAGIFIQFFSPPGHDDMFLAGKAVNGFAIGMYMSGASNYIVEVSPVALRGVTTSALNFWIVIGQFLGMVMIQIAGIRTDAYSYRIVFGVEWVFPLIMLAGLPFLPESPLWLVRRERFDDAIKALKRLSGPAADTGARMRRIQETIVLEQNNAMKATYAELFRGVDRKRTIIACMAFVGQQLVGVTFVLGFSTYFFELAGFSPSNAFALGVGIMGLAIIGNLFAAWTVNGLGRRFLYVIGLFLCALCNLLIGVLSLPDQSGTNWAMAIFTMIYMVIYQAGIGPVAFTICSEISSARLRSKTVGFSICFLAFSSLVANVINPYLVNPDELNLGGKVGFIFGGLGVLGTVWAWFFVPETGGRSVEELDVLFEMGVPARMFSQTNAKLQIGPSN